MEPWLSASDTQLQQRFSALEKPQDIANLLEVDYTQLEYWLFIARPERKYRIFTLPKPAGGLRKISAPVGSLKIIQQKLNEVLRAVYEVKATVHGFAEKRSIVSNAQVHAGQHFIFNIDLQDFFPSINFGRVRGLFIGRPYCLPENVATVLAQICCFENGLPQGAPTSPIVSKHDLWQAG
jgi:RNA-directed DNA polymerase